MSQYQGHWNVLAQHARLLHRFAKADVEARRELVLRFGGQLYGAIWWAKDLNDPLNKSKFLDILKDWFTTLRGLLDDGRLGWDHVRGGVFHLAKGEHFGWVFGESFDLMLDMVKVHGTERELRHLIEVRVSLPAWRDEVGGQMLCEKYGLLYQPPAERFADASRALGLDTFDLGGDPPPIRSYEHRS